MAINGIPTSPGHKGKAPADREPVAFSCELVVDQVPETGLDVAIAADPLQCARLAKVCGLDAVHLFEAQFHIRKRADGRFKVTGDLKARVTQICVVSLEPFEAPVEASIEVEFARPGALGPASQKDEEPPDPILDGKIDLGALAVEFLVLNLDLYPRKEGVAFAMTEEGRPEPERDSPFAVLRHRS
ncbi:MAG TPA: DUF177 domain-containing protein [Methylocella sp.]|nr:DUF177 domain-containing protein [Methylocella sp.]